MMATESGLTASSLTQNLAFNWVFLIELLVCGVLTLFFLFYFNRLFAAIISYGIRAWTWHKYRVYIDIQALQFSLLGGRIFFRGFRYHGNNETILIHSGYITWSYWIRKVRSLDLGHEKVKKKRVSLDSDVAEGTPVEATNLENGGVEKSTKLPCRINVSLRGVEWFIYNRVPAYESIMFAMTQEDDNSHPIESMEKPINHESEGLKKRSAGTSGEKTEELSNINTLPDSLKEKDTHMREQESHESSTTAGTTEHVTRNDNDIEGNLFLQFLPFHVDCNKAAVVMGNENTRSVFIIKADKASGDIDASRCNPLDQYRQLINFQLEHPVVQIKANDDYKEDQATTASKTKEGPKEQLKDHNRRHNFLHRYRRKAWHRIQYMIPYFQRSVESFSSAGDDMDRERPNSNQWQGLSRYLDEDEQDDKAKWSSIEYATVSTILDSPSAKLSYYWDIPGSVPGRSSVSSGSDQNNINGDESPAWGLDLFIRGASVNYGPWADRQRADLQRVFFPSLFKDGKPAEKLQRGRARVATAFKLYVQLDEETILRVPIKEESKNWKWKSQADIFGRRLDQKKKQGKHGRKRKSDKGEPGPEIRPFGWLDIKVAANSTISYSMDMVPGPTGFSNSLEIDLPNTEITTSVNHGLLWKSVDQHLTCNLSNPIRWNSLHTWHFDIVSNGLELFILREHVFLLIDLVDDWGSGPPPEYLSFTPFRYLVNLKFSNFRLYLNANDSNIINNPSDFDDNTFMIIFGTHLNVDVCIPLDRFRPYRNEVSFDLNATTGGLNLHVPPWNTQSTFLKSTQLATLTDLGIKGKYQYCSTTSSANTDVLVLELNTKDLVVETYGFLIRYVMKLKDNYFGDDIHFKTLEEHQLSLQSKDDEVEAIGPATQPHKKSNDLDVIMSIECDDVKFLLPTNLYSAKTNISIELSTLVLDLRFTNYYMDMKLALAPLALSLSNEDDAFGTPVSATSSSQLYIDGIDVYGHRVFGLPHSEPTYVCNWDFSVGNVTGECTTDFLVHLAAGAKAFAFSFDDDENALSSTVTILHDITFLRASVQPVRIWLHVDEAAFLLATGKVEVNFNDWAGKSYSKKLHLDLPDLVLACVDAESASRHRSRRQVPVDTHAYFSTSIKLTKYDRKIGFVEDRLLQQVHVRREDSRTRRGDFLLHADILEGTAINMPATIDPPAMCFPPLPLPLQKDDASTVTDTSSSSQASLLERPEIRRQSSFLSISSSSQRSDMSVVRSRSNISYVNVRSANAGSRSRSLQSRNGPGTARRDISVSTTGRQSSFYSAVGDIHDRNGPPTSAAVFSSTYMAPNFPLETVDPDVRNVPSLDIDDGYLDDISAPEQIDMIAFDDRAAHSSLIFELKDGVRGHCNPNAISAVVQLLTAMDPIEPEDIIDSIQTNTISNVFSANKKDIMTGNTTELKIVIPTVHLRIISPSTQSYTNPETDQFDIVLRGIVLTTKSGITPMSLGESTENRNASIVHLRLASADLTAKALFAEMDEARAVIGSGVEDVVFWMVSKEKTSVNLKLRTLGFATSSQKVDQLAGLLDRSRLLATQTSDKFEILSSAQEHRIRLFSLLVSKAGAEATDPLFLTKPAYVLRSAANHLRTRDSWKVVSRLRQMWATLSPANQEDIAMQCLLNEQKCPIDARQQVLSIFDQWRSWDLEDVSNCIAIRDLFGPMADPNYLADNSPKCLQVELAIEETKFVLHPGPKQNELSFRTIVVKASSDTESKQESGKAWYESQHTQVEVYCVDAVVNLNWELCELAQDILKLYNDSQSNSQVNSPISARTPTTPVSTTVPKKHDYHLVLITDKGSITLETINLKAISISKGLKGSIVGSQNEGEKLTTINVMLAAEAATSKIKSHSQELTFSQVRQPSIFVSFDAQETDSALCKTWKAAANSQELSFVVRQDMLVLLEVADLLLGDEATQLKQVLLHLPKAETKKPSHEHKLRVTTRVNIALFLDMYHISFPLLHSMTYNISGVIARASVAANLGSNVVFDFDIKDSAHEIQTMGNNESRGFSLLQMPPTNGRITSQINAEDHLLSAFISVEPIHVDAAVIHSLLTALNMPEVGNVLVEVQDRVRGIQKHVSEVLGTTESRPAKVSHDSSKPLVFDAQFTLAGLEVFAETTSGKSQGKTARLSFNVGSVQIKASNRLEPHGAVLEFLEIHVNMQRIVFELSRLTADGMLPCGNFTFAACLTAGSKTTENGDEVRSYHVNSDSLEINLFADTASTVVDVIGHLQDRIKDLDLSREVRYLQKLRKPNPRIAINLDSPSENSTGRQSNIFSSVYSLELLDIQVCWIVGTVEKMEAIEQEDLVLSFKRIELSTRKENSAKLTIEDFQLQMVPASQDRTQRTQNSALLPEVVFNVAYIFTHDARRLAFQAVGKSLDLRLTSQFIIPAAALKKSIESSIEKVRSATGSWTTTPTPNETQTDTKRKTFLDQKRIESLLVDADFAGAMVHLQNKKPGTASAQQGTGRVPSGGRYGQFSQEDTSNNTVLRAPGLAWKLEFKDNGIDDPSLNAEVKIDASSNILYPTVVPLILEISSSVKELVSEEDENQKSTQKSSPQKGSPQKFMSSEDDNILTADPSTVLGRTKLNLGLRICKQEFSLSCQPIARVAAIAKFDDIYVTINTVRSVEQGHFFAVSAAFTNLQASVQHVYSRESTGSFAVKSIVLSLMNSKHVNGTSGVSAILKISPMKILVNAKQLQDFLLFREIWVPPEIRQSSDAPVSSPPNMPPQAFLVQRYQEVAATGAFPWNATVSIEELDVQLDLGQAIGKSSFVIAEFWVSSKKNSDWEQNLCFGFENVGIDSTGRMSGFVSLRDFGVRTLIQWPEREKALSHTPLVQASLSFSQFRVKAAFDYQPFLVSDITSFKFLMHNVRSGRNTKGDRLVAILDGDSVQAFCTTTTASQALALYQAFQRLVQEKRTNYETSLKEIERFMKRKSVAPTNSVRPVTSAKVGGDVEQRLAPISLYTDVVVTLKAVNIGVFPSTFYDHQVFKMEALDAQARFAVTMDNGKIHSALGLTVGQLRVGLAGVKQPAIAKVNADLTVEEVVESATGSRGGTILKVPKVDATMETWQRPDSNHIDYIFKSSFEGKVEVGWNYSRISYIRGMYGNHSRALAQRLGKPLPPSAVKITGVPGEDEKDGHDKQQKITAEVTMPQSKYEYTALEPSIIETPQLRDMGEATPPLEWIGLHRDRLPNLTHQIVIVTLLELASEVDDAYSKILGSS